MAHPKTRPCPLTDRVLPRTSRAAAGSAGSSCTCRCSASRCSTWSSRTTCSRCSCRWELVGVCSFFLIGFYYERPSASRRREQGVHRQPHRRRRFPGRHPDRLDLLRHAELRGAVPPRCVAGEGFARPVRTGQSASFASNRSAESAQDDARQYELPPAGSNRTPAAMCCSSRSCRDHPEPLPRPWPRPAQGCHLRRAREGRLTSTTASMPYWLFVVMGIGHLPRVRRQERAVAAAHLAAGRDGRPDAGLGA